MVGIGQQRSFSISKGLRSVDSRAVELFKINSAQPSNAYITFFI